MHITGLYAYRIEGIAVGIVKANSHEEAKEKVKATYLKHSEEYNPEINCIEIKELTEGEAWFYDNPDVIEVDDLI